MHALVLMYRPRVSRDNAELGEEQEIWAIDVLCIHAIYEQKLVLIVLLFANKKIFWNPLEIIDAGNVLTWQSQAERYYYPPKSQHDFFSSFFFFSVLMVVTCCVWILAQWWFVLKPAIAFEVEQQISEAPEGEPWNALCAGVRGQWNLSSSCT